MSIHISLPRALTVVAAVGLVVALSNVTSAEIVTIIDEEFTNGAEPTNTSFVTWSHNAAGGFETYASGGAGPRDMNNNYDHDQNSGTPNVTIPGGIELNTNTGGVTLTAAMTLTLPAGTFPDGDLLTFYAGVRSGNGIPTITILNITDSTTILPTTNIAINSDDNIWEYNSFTNLFSASDVGDTINIQWFASGSNSASGLQMADVELTVNAIPEPSTLILFGAGLGALIGSRRRKARK